MIKTDLHTLLFDLKAATGLKSEEFRNLLGLPEKRWIEISSGSGALNLQELNRISSIFHVKIDYLIKGVVDLVSISKRFHNSSFAIEKIKTMGSRNLCTLNFGKELYTNKCEHLSAN
ncbi:MAG: hypothetical protein COW00_06745 [Bdellovibrio sp. CG12_big_fil_rev_8_21_14_0_65_39_13]|nr:MAG: hypothetical protein COW78_04240 [Bdellovibrio sp. CG22_combo_CG10-13_8_21_14_all_39_27]PIQ60450.1 MAG: hypothetical protein COW00_06745 [Bdellovibrio sp. CG12_big_fil_rev_8_21_14_0_65_39_13]PIR34973.1 MAG: hypothetical protein COV37_11045 [Bdellovibrio sp. CG11_big_fil_rev_8_21_14_0_20_39_38]